MTPDKTMSDLHSLLGYPDSGDPTLQTAQPAAAPQSAFPVDANAADVLGPYQTPQAQPSNDAGVSGVLAADQHGIESANALEGELRAKDARDNERFNKIDAENKAAGDAAVSAASERSRLMQPLLDDVQAKFEALSERANAVQQNSQVAVQEQMAKWDAARLDAANSQVHDFFADKTTAGHVVGIISAALGGFANGLAGNPGAPTALDRVIQRDLEVQIQNLNQKNRVADAERGKLQVLMSNGLNQLEAIASLRAGLNDKIKIIAADVANRMGTQDAQARAAQIQADRDADTQKIRSQTEANTFNARVQLEGKKLLLESHQAAFIASVARGVIAHKDGLLDADVANFPENASPRDRTGLSKQITALKNAYALVGQEDNNIAPIGNTNPRTLLQNELATIYGGPNGARAVDFKRAEDVVGGRYSGIFTDTASRRHAALKSAAAQVRASLAGGTPRGDFAATLDKIDALE